MVEAEDQCNKPEDNADCCFLKETYVEQRTVRFIPCAPFAAISLCVGYPAAMAWYVSMKVAVMLALEDVTSVLRAATKSALADDAIRFAFMGIYMYSVLEFSENTQRQKAAIVSKQSH